MRKTYLRGEGGEGGLRVGGKITCNIVDLFNPLNADLNPICQLLALLGAHLIFHVSELRVNVAKDRRMADRWLNL